MPRPNKFHIEGLRQDSRGFCFEYYLKRGGKLKKKRLRLGHISFEDAAGKVKALKDAIKEGKNLEYVVKQGITFREAAASFLDYSRSHKKSYYQDCIYVKHWQEFFDERHIDMPLEHMNLDVIEEFQAWRRKANPDLSGVSLNRNLMCLKTIVRRAILNGHLSKNPIRGMRLHREIPRDRVISPEEFRKLLEQCPSHLKPAVMLGWYTGMRSAEVRNLRFNQINFQNGFIVLEAGDTKTQEKRLVPLTEELVEVLRKIPQTIGTQNVFTYRGKPLRTIRTGFRTACKKSGIENFHFHDLRHCAVTNMRRAGVPETVIMSISGHKTSAVFRRYSSVDVQDQLEAIERVRAWAGLETNKRRKFGQAGSG